MSVRRVATCLAVFLLGAPVVVGLIAMCCYGVAAPWASFKARDAAFRAVVLDPLCVYDTNAFSGLMVGMLVAGAVVGSLLVPARLREMEDRR